MLFFVCNSGNVNTPPSLLVGNSDTGGDGNNGDDIGDGEGDDGDGDKVANDYDKVTEKEAASSCTETSFIGNERITTNRISYSF